ncbi:MAG: hypothetical protein QNL03_13570 [Gammaproteobacteria bacterium]|nr:hypothetical protein [Gammaproteobacteria bacterium]
MGWIAVGDYAIGIDFLNTMGNSVQEMGELLFVLTLSIIISHLLIQLIFLIIDRDHIKTVTVLRCRHAELKQYLID